jgi:hypothetical protein
MSYLSSKRSSSGNSSKMQNTFFDKEENRPATKKDIKEIIPLFKQRYFNVKYSFKI